MKENYDISEISRKEILSNNMLLDKDLDLLSFEHTREYTRLLPFEISNAPKRSISIGELLRPQIRFIAVEAPDSSISDEDVRSAAEIVNLTTEIPDYTSMFATSPVRPLVTHVGELKTTARATLTSVEPWRMNDPIDLLTGSTTVTPNKRVFVFEAKGAALVQFNAEKAIKDALHYISQRPAGPEEQ
jgi:hypothetical protein